ncbi:MAG: hypothetical protein EXR47_01925 [Dehalococcoidia bacterium]|nr:hypothetical protein [Dehalococcoidia bacterium]
MHTFSLSDFQEKHALTGVEIYRLDQLAGVAGVQKLAKELAQENGRKTTRSLIFELSDKVRDLVESRLEDKDFAEAAGWAFWWFFLYYAELEFSKEVPAFTFVRRYGMILKLFNGLVSFGGIKAEGRNTKVVNRGHNLILIAGLYHFVGRIKERDTMLENIRNAIGQESTSQLLSETMSAAPMMGQQVLVDALIRHVDSK